MESRSVSGRTMWPWRRLLQALGMLASSACHVGYDFRGPGFDADTGRARSHVPATVVVAVTAADVQSGASARFRTELDRVMADLTGREGLVGFAVRKQTFGRRIWTLSAWVDDASLDRFLDDVAHRRAVRDGGVSRPSFRDVRTRMAADRLPLTWNEAIALLPDEP